MTHPGKTYYPNILTVSGTGRKVGKTTLACSLIKRMSNHEKVIGIKISPHFHEVDYHSSLTEKPQSFAVYEEDRIDRGKDSSYMLAAGADKVYYVQTHDEYLGEVWGFLSGVLEKDAPVIIESGRIHNLVRPGISLLLTIQDEYGQTLKMEKITGQSDFSEVISEKENFGPVIDRIGYKDGRWIIHENHDYIR